MSEKEQVNLTSSSNPGEKELQPIIQECENIYQTVQLQLHQYKEEKDGLKMKLQSVIQENSSLAELLQAVSNQQTLKEIDGLVPDLHKNIQEQLKLALQEKDSALELWQTALQLVTALESELKDYRDNSHLTNALEKVNEVRGEYSKAICLLEEKLTVATSQLGKEKAGREFIELQLQQLQNSFKLLNERYDKRSREADQALADQKATQMKLSDLEKSYSKALEDAKEATLSCSELEEALEQTVARLEKALSQKDEAQEKVAEALQIVDAAMIERGNAVSQATEAKEEASKLQAAIAELISEAGTHVQAEAEQIKEQYNVRIRAVLVDMRRLQEENKSKSIQIQKLRSDLNSMENEVHRTKKELETMQRDRPSLSALDRKLEGLFRAQEIAGSDAIRTELEFEQLKAEIVKVNQCRELEQRQFTLEQHLLQEQVKALQLELENASITVADVSTRADVLTTTLKHKEHEVKVLKQALASSLAPHYGPGKRDDPQLWISDHIRRIEEGNKMHHELQNQLDCQRKLAQRWKSEVRDITSRFQSRLWELRSKVASLEKENCELRNYLKTKEGHHFLQNTIETNMDDHCTW